MPNPLFERQGARASGPAQGGGVIGMMYNKLYRNVPEFRDFVNQSKGKSIDQICAEKGIDPSRVKGMSEDDIANFLAKQGLL